MRRTTNTTKILLAALAVTIILAFVLPLNAQVVGGDKDVTVTSGDSKTELANGVWVLTGTNTSKFNNANITKWGGYEQNISANCSWIDILNIEHSISCSFKWLDVPKTMSPGAATKFAVEYVYDDYASTNKIVHGIKAKFDDAGADYLAAGPNVLDIVKLTKDNKNYSSETKTLYFIAPKTFLGETNQIQLMVDCFMGQDHYVTYYTYTWTGDEQASK